MPLNELLSLASTASCRYITSMVSILTLSEWILQKIIDIGADVKKMSCRLRSWYWCGGMRNLHSFRVCCLWRIRLEVEFDSAILEKLIVSTIWCGYWELWKSCVWLSTNFRKRHEVQWLWNARSSMRCHLRTSLQSLMQSDETKLKASAKMFHNHDATVVVNLWRS